MKRLFFPQVTQEKSKQKYESKLTQRLLSGEKKGKLRLFLECFSLMRCISAYSPPRIICQICINPLTAGHENIWAGFKCPQCYATVNTMRYSRALQGKG
jgi:hypothetical protein